MENNKFSEYPKNIYIICTVSTTLSLKSRMRFYHVQKQLKNIGFTVVNRRAIVETAKEISYLDHTRKNFKKLIACDWVYIMPDVSLEKGDNTEVKISLDLNMTILHGSVVTIDLEEFV